MKQAGADGVTEISNAIACYNQHTQTRQEFVCGVGYYRMELVYVAAADGDYVINLIFHSGQSELWIFPAIPLLPIAFAAHCSLGFLRQMSTWLTQERLR